MKVLMFIKFIKYQMSGFFYLA